MSTEVTFTPDKSFLERLNDVESTLGKMESKIEKIYDALCGNEKFDQLGLISRLKKLEEENEKFKALKNKLVGAFLVGGAVWAIIWEIVKKMIIK
jgi:hypothetical protein